jgi:hypothetical protein
VTIEGRKGGHQERKGGYHGMLSTMVGHQGRKGRRKERRSHHTIKKPRKKEGTNT